MQLRLGRGGEWYRLERRGVTWDLVAPPAYERGSGCRGTTAIDCFLDYVPNGGDTHVLFNVSVTGAGVHTITLAATDAVQTATLTLAFEIPIDPGRKYVLVVADPNQTIAVVHYQHGTGKSREPEEACDLETVVSAGN